MPTPIVLIADDLTGALDSASPFHAAGHRVAVAAEPAGIAAALDRAPDVLVINSDSRALDPAAAAARVVVTWNAVASRSPRIVMKKIDSRLKGPIAAEVDALLTASGRIRALACPAVPDIGRIVRDGCIQGAGVAEPIVVSDHMPHGPRVEVADAGDEAAMRAVAASVLAEPETILAVGARGLAQALAEMTCTAERGGQASSVAALPMVVAIGSRDPITQAQVEELRRAVPEIVEWPALGGGVCSGASVVLIRTDGESEGLEPDRVATRLADDVAALVDRLCPATLLASGGETAIAIARALRIDLLVPEGELLAGIPVSRAPKHGALRFATKSGGFGASDALAVIAAAAMAQDSVQKPASYRRRA